MKKIVIINGVNLGILGTREITTYGGVDFLTYLEQLKAKFPQFEIIYYQTNYQDEIVNLLLFNKNIDGIVLNPGAFTHTSIIIADAIKSIDTKVIEVHISNIFAREQYRKNSFIASACIGSISGFGLRGYELAINFFL